MENENTVTCDSCGESWDEDTPGYREAEEMLRVSGGDTCPACVPYNPFMERDILEPSMVFKVDPEKNDCDPIVLSKAQAVRLWTMARHAYFGAENESFKHRHGSLLRETEERNAKLYLWISECLQ